MTLAGRYGTDEATLLRFEGETLRFEGPRALAPGAPVVIAIARDEGALSIEGRSLGSRRVGGDGARFEIRARLVNLRKTDREWLAANLTAPG